MPEDTSDEKRQLPLDSDLEAAETATGASRPVHLRWQYLGVVFLGATGGTAARYFLSAIIPAWQGIPIGTFAINIVGAFTLGALLEALVRRGPDAGARRTLRLLLGTGLLGGFTTYSSLAVDTGVLVADGQFVSSLLYGVGTVLIGALATAAGIVTAAAHHGWRPPLAKYARANGGATK